MPCCTAPHLTKQYDISFQKLTGAQMSGFFSQLFAESLATVGNKE